MGKALKLLIDLIRRGVRSWLAENVLGLAVSFKDKANQ